MGGRCWGGPDGPGRPPGGPPGPFWGPGGVWVACGPPKPPGGPIWGIPVGTPPGWMPVNMAVAWAPAIAALTVFSRAVARDCSAEALFLVTSETSFGLGSGLAWGWLAAAMA